MRIVKFYLPKESINDATLFYVNLIKEAFLTLDFEIEVFDHIFKADPTDFIVTIRAGDYFFIKRKNPMNQIVNWFQGIGPEEYKMLHGRSLKSMIMPGILEFWEKKALRGSKMCLFVSAAMKLHFEKKYKLQVNQACIIPCYNKHLKDDLVLENQSRYKALTFVYAGGLFAWQCIDRTLEIYKLIEDQHPEASLALLTGDKDAAEKLIKKYNIKNAVISYIPLDQLDKELCKYKYGFLLREQDIVNIVSTPTKMNSYLSVGNIPIYTNVVDSFEKNLKLEGFQVKANLDMSNNEIVDLILNHHKRKINSNDYLEQLKKVFHYYYNDEKYLSILTSQLKNFINE